MESATYPMEDFWKILADWSGGEEFDEVRAVLAGALGFVLLDLAGGMGCRGVQLLLNTRCILYGIQL